MGSAGPLLEPASDLELIKGDDPDILEKCSFREIRFIRAYLGDGLFNKAAAVSFAYPTCPEEKRAAYGARILQRPHVKAALREIASQAIGTLKDRLEYTVLRFLSKAAFHNPFEIIDGMGKMKQGIDIENLGESAALIQDIDPRTGKVSFFSREKAIDALSKYANITKEAEMNVTINNNLVILPAKQGMEQWNAAQE